MHTTTKLCTDCKHCQQSNDEYNCKHPLVQHDSLVTGAAIRVECLSARMSPCGADGKYWEAKEGAQ